MNNNSNKMKTKKLLAIFASIFIAMLVLITCKKDNFVELVGICPQPKIEFTVALSSNPLAGGTTIGAGTFAKDSIITVGATPSLAYTFTNWTNGAVIVSTNSSYTFPLVGNTVLVANFTPVIPGNFNLITTSNPLAGGTTLGSGSFAPSTSVTVTAVANAGYTFTNWTDGALVVSTNSIYTFTLTANKNLVANFTPIVVVCPTVVNLGLSGNFAIFAESGISTTGVTLITGDIGVNPVTSTAITGFGLILPAGSAFSTSSLVVGKVYAPDYAVPSPANMVTTSGDMHTAYTTANGLVVPAPTNEFMAGNLNGQTLTAGIWKWSSGVSITNGIVLDGGGDNCATFIFQIAQNLTVANSAIITLQNGAQAKNIFWVVAGSGAVLGTNVNFQGNILCKTLISVNTGGHVTGRLLAQTAVTLNASTIIKP
jgi:hypothetical protein